MRQEATHDLFPAGQETRGIGQRRWLQKQPASSFPLDNYGTFKRSVE